MILLSYHTQSFLKGKQLYSASSVIITFIPHFVYSDLAKAEEKLLKVFREAAKRSPCFILIDNIDLICRQRSSSNTSDFQKRIVSSILTLIDGLDEEKNKYSDVRSLDATMKKLNSTNSATADCIIDGKRIFILATTSKPGLLNSPLLFVALV